MLSILVILSFVTLAFAAPSKTQGLNADLEIVGGNETAIEKIPYQLQLERKGEFACGASLIAPNWAVTAAHCTDPYLTREYQIRAGSAKMSSGGQVVNIIRLYQHKLYNDNTIDYDITILELEKNVTLNKAVQPIPLVEAYKTFKNGTNCTISGWGATSEHSDVSDKLQVAFVPVVDHKLCNEEYHLRRPITDRMLCAGFVETGGVDSCQGDSGGPLAIDGKLAGIVSWGYGCARKNYPGVYTNVANLRDFIEQITGL